MIFYFRSLSLFNKDVTLLMKAVKSELKDVFKLHQAQNMMARMYGWSHYAKMYESHENHHLMVNQFIENLTSMERDFLEQQKKMVLLSELLALQLSGDEINIVIHQYFNGQSTLSKILSGNKNATYSNFHQIPDHLWSLGTLFIGPSNYKTVDWIRKLTLQQAVVNGGVFILRKSVADEIVADFEELLCLEGLNRLQTVHLEQNATVDGYERRLDPLCNDISHEQFRSFLHIYCQETLIGYHHGNEKYFQIEFVAALRMILRSMQEFQDGYCFKALYSEGVLSPEWVYKEICRRPSTDKNILPMLEFLRGITGFDECLFKRGKRQPAQMYTNFNLRLEGLYEFIGIFNNPDKKHIKSLDMKKALLTDAITIIIIDDEHVRGNRLAKVALANIRSAVAPMLGNRLEFGDEKVEPARYSFKPIVFDDYLRYVIPGMSVVMAQLSPLGFAPFYGVSQLGSLEEKQNYEWQMLQHNAQNRFFSYGCTHYDILATQEDKLCFDLDPIIRSTQEHKFVFSAAWLTYNNQFHVIQD